MSEWKPTKSELLQHSIEHIDIKRHNVVPLVQSMLARWIGERRADPRIEVVVARIIGQDGLVSIDGLADRTSLTRRHLERVFLEAVGITPKRLARIARFQKAVRVLEQAEPRRRGTITAAACGYADQSHFIREFRQLAGCSPSEHLLRHGEMTGFFIDRSSQSPA